MLTTTLYAGVVTGWLEVEITGGLWDLKSALEDALSGRRRLVALVGQTGIVNTLIVQELAIYAGLRGRQGLRSGMRA